MARLLPFFATLHMQNMLTICDFHPEPEIPRDPIKILTVPGKADFCRHGITFRILNFFRFFFKFAVSVPKDSTKNWITGEGEGEVTVFSAKGWDRRSCYALIESALLVITLNWLGPSPTRTQTPAA